MGNQSKDTRNPTTGRTAAEDADYQAGSGGAPHPSSPNGNAPKPAPANIAPYAPAKFGAPLGETILSGGSK